MTIKALALPLIALLMLGACKSDATVARERSNVVRQLPEGCALHDLGEYDEIEQMVVIICEGRDTTTTNTMWMESQGKSATYKQAVSVSIN